MVAVPHVQLIILRYTELGVKCDKQLAIIDW